MRVPLAKDGASVVAVGSVVLLAAAGVCAWLTAVYAWPLLIAVGMALALWVWLLWFFRDPERETPAGAGLFISPADGVVTDITPLGPDSDLRITGRRIGIFMNVLDVHVNRAPCDGVVREKKLSRGGRANVSKPAAWEANESVTLVLDYYPSPAGKPVPLAVRQVAGLIARRIICHPEIGDKLTRGSRFGMIRFGSRLEVMLPDVLEAQVLVAPGQKVYAGSTVLASHAMAGQPKPSPQEVRP